MALLDSGISDKIVDHTLDGVILPGVYRATFQSEAWTRRAWGDHFEILDYLPRVALGLQDIMVLRKREQRSKPRNARTAHGPILVRKRGRPPR